MNGALAAPASLGVGPVLAAWLSANSPGPLPVVAFSGSVAPGVTIGPGAASASVVGSGPPPPGAPASDALCARAARTPAQSAMKTHSPAAADARSDRSLMKRTHEAR